MNKRLLVIIPVFLVFLLSCKKNAFITSQDARIQFSSDTLYFDTVFVTTGSVTQSLKVINENNAKLKLDDIKLMGGTASVFKINIDGASTTNATDIELAANDSLYLFISVYINPDATNLPFILRDSIQVSFNGNIKYIQLQAWGQNAHFLKNTEITGNVTWPNDLPYVILGGLHINNDATLTIQKGGRVYAHADAPLLVDGTLLAEGDSNARVYFLGDRLDAPYNGFPGSWPGIIFSAGSKDNQLEYAVIKNAYQGIVSAGPSINSNPKIVLDECIIDNVYDAGISAIQTSIRARNCLFSNCGKNILISAGGDYQFTNCTVASFSNDYLSHANPVLFISNYLANDNTSIFPLNANFLNCIFWGDGGLVDDEVVVSSGGGSPVINFSNCIWKVKNNPVGVNATNILNSDPLFDSVNNQLRIYDFHLRDGSPALGFGQPVPTIPFDLDGQPRIVAGKTDLGCYEKQ